MRRPAENSRQSEHPNPASLARRRTIKAIDGDGSSVWVLYDKSLHRYTHDPLAVFP